jgi:hypothetical protein
MGKVGKPPNILGKLPNILLYCSWFRSLRCRTMQKLRLHFLTLLSKAPKKLRVSQAQAKKLAKKLRLDKPTLSPPAQY